jgi:hypothetical protein
MTFKVIALPEVRFYLTDLIRILFEKDYFSFEENAIEYVTDLVSKIEKGLPYKVKKPAPALFQRYGKDLYYSSFRKNRETTWYVFYTIHYDILTDTATLLIRFISNNHVIGQHLFDQ